MHLSSFAYLQSPIFGDSHLAFMPQSKSLSMMITKTLKTSMFKDVTYGHFAAGGIAGAVSRTIVSPLELLKIVLQVQHGPASSLSQVTKEIFRTDGVLGFFKGNGANMLRIAPYSATQFATYEVSKRILLGHSGRTQLKPVERLLAGSLAGVACAAVTYPLDLIRTQMAVSTQSTIADTVRSIIKADGLLGLYKGLVPTLVGVAPYVGINFATYETLKANFGENQELTGGQRLLCGSIAGALSQTVTYPLELVRRLFQVRTIPGSPVMQSTTIMATLKEIVATNGVAGLYRGLLPNYLKVVPAMAVSFFAYDTLKSGLKKL
eukprot:TRINITY_DN40677_c0_g1_i1.p1 TRINITY_DN40677_c0_g1~~TRINITY_DN40677_c0_g1_i1.p1  ORF type:complete len:321 (+),score=54.95 TRINITY_DN40677_c0_g1_i1:221-1183(+)